jgi:DNA modification methylase
VTFTLHHGDCLEVMASMDAGSVDAVVTDPPYGLEFMGKHWDHGLPSVDFWTEALRILKPSHYLLAFGGTRTWHRLACALEDAGFEIRDTLMWLYGSGFPKGTACLKPAWEPIILARKPGPKRALGIEECRIGTTKDVPASGTDAGSVCYGKRGPRTVDMDGFNPNLGRYPANLILDEEAGAMLDGMTGNRQSGGRIDGGSCVGLRGNEFDHPCNNPIAGDSGGASRFFYCAKASRSERDGGMWCVPESEYDHSGARGHTLNGDGSPRPRPRPRANTHPTVKPLALMKWLVKLVAHPGDTVLDPFTGSGTTGVACVELGRDFVGIEREAEYVEIARRRIEAAAAQERLPV